MRKNPSPHPEKLAKSHRNQELFEESVQAPSGVHQGSSSVFAHVVRAIAALHLSVTSGDWDRLSLS